jgi:guanylate kinase
MSPRHNHLIKDVLILCGPSGCGKSTLITRLTEEFPGKFGFCVSHTTRGPRSGEQDGIHYDRHTLEHMVTRNEFLESAQVHGNMYGTSFAAVDSVRSSGKVCVLDIDVQGVQAVKHDGRLPALYVFLRPPTVDALEARLRARGTESDEKIVVRIGNAKKEILASEISGMWDAVFTNDHLETCYEEFRSFVKSKFPQILA